MGTGPLDWCGPPLALCRGTRDGGGMDTVTMTRRSAPDVPGYLLATGVGLGVLAVSMAVMLATSPASAVLIVVTTLAYGLLPAVLLGAVTAVAMELLALRTPSLALQVGMAALVGAAGAYGLTQQWELALLVALAGVIGRLAMAARRPI